MSRTVAVGSAGSSLGSFSRLGRPVVAGLPGRLRCCPPPIRVFADRRTDLQGRQQPLLAAVLGHRPRVLSISCLLLSHSLDLSTCAACQLGLRYLGQEAGLYRCRSLAFGRVHSPLVGQKVNLNLKGKTDQSNEAREMAQHLRAPTARAGHKHL